LQAHLYARVQAEITAAIAPIKKNFAAGKGMHGKWASGNSGWLDKYAKRLVTIAVEEDMMSFDDEVMVAIGKQVSRQPDIL
jgi:hypothetical protein